MDISIFTDKLITPQTKELSKALGDTYNLWQNIAGFVHSNHPKAEDEWKYPGVKYGWGFRIKDKKRVIIYLLPRDGYFKVALVFGQKATDEVMATDVSKSIKQELATAKLYAEGRGIRIDVKSEDILTDIKTLISIKLAH